MFKSFLVLNFAATPSKSMERAQIVEPFKQKANKNKSRTYKGFYEN
jgi:hypothetical protein